MACLPGCRSVAVMFPFLVTGSIDRGREAGHLLDGFSETRLANGFCEIPLDQIDSYPDTYHVGMSSDMIAL